MKSDAPGLKIMGRVKGRGCRFYACGREAWRSQDERVDQFYNNGGQLSYSVS